MTALNDLENLTCNVDGSNVLPSISENLYCRISPTIGICVHIFNFVESFNI